MMRRLSSRRALVIMSLYAWAGALVANSESSSSLCNTTSSCFPSPLPENFGVTHFIVGYPHGAQRHTTQKKPTLDNDVSDITVLFSPDDDLQKALLN